MCDDWKLIYYYASTTPSVLGRLKADTPTKKGNIAKELFPLSVNFVLYYFFFFFFFCVPRILLLEMAFLFPSKLSSNRVSLNDVLEMCF